MASCEFATIKTILCQIDYCVWCWLTTTILVTTNFGFKENFLLSMQNLYLEYKVHLYMFCIWMHFFCILHNTGSCNDSSVFIDLIEDVYWAIINLVFAIQPTARNVDGSIGPHLLLSGVINSHRWLLASCRIFRFFLPCDAMQQQFCLSVRHTHGLSPNTETRN